MVPQDFNPGPGEEKTMPTEIHDHPQERAPGVYVRAEHEETPHELDLLWANNRAYQKEDRSPIIPFVAGFLIGGVLTTAVFLLFIMKPDFAQNGQGLFAPLSKAFHHAPADEMSLPSGAEPGVAPGVNNDNTTGAATGTMPAVAGASTTYVVKPGDTLGSIAEKVYNSASPDLVLKIQTANAMKNPNALKLDQKLTIPPKG